MAPSFSPKYKKSKWKEAIRNKTLESYARTTILFWPIMNKKSLLKPNPNKQMHKKAGGTMLDYLEGDRWRRARSRWDALREPERIGRRRETGSCRPLRSSYWIQGFPSSSSSSQALLNCLRWEELDDACMGRNPTINWREIGCGGKRFHRGYAGSTRTSRSCIKILSNGWVVSHLVHSAHLDLVLRLAQLYFQAKKLKLGLI